MNPETLVHVSFTETKTIILLDIASIAVSNDATEEAAAIKASNQKYVEVKESIKIISPLGHYS